LQKDSDGRTIEFSGRTSEKITSKKGGCKMIKKIIIILISILIIPSILFAQSSYNFKAWSEADRIAYIELAELASARMKKHAGHRWGGELKKAINQVNLSIATMQQMNRIPTKYNQTKSKSVVKMIWAMKEIKKDLKAQINKRFRE